jgi:hypothetical protein
MKIQVTAGQLGISHVPDSAAGGVIAWEALGPEYLRLDFI